MQKENSFLGLTNPDSRGSDFILTLALVLIAFMLLGNIPVLLASYKLGVYSIEGLTAHMDLNLLFTFILFPFVVGILTLIGCNKYLQKMSFKSMFTAREHFDWKRFWFSFLIWGGLLGVFFVLSLVFGSPIEFQPNWSAFIVLTIVSFTLLPLQTTFEELFFRSFLFKAFGKTFNKGWLTVLFTGVLFGLMHGANPEVEKIGNILLVFYILNGVFLGLIVLMDEGLELSMGYHAINNIYAALIVTNDWQAFHTDALFIDKSPPAFGLENILTLVLIQPLLLVVFSKKYGWKNWKGKLFAKLNTDTKK
jgi:membrane protease YdiL (CAAX protease family)